MGKDPYWLISSGHAADLSARVRNRRRRRGVFAIIINFESRVCLSFLSF